MMRKLLPIFLVFVLLYCTQPGQTPTPQTPTPTPPQVEKPTGLLPLKYAGNFTLVQGQEGLVGYSMFDQSRRWAVAYGNVLYGVRDDVTKERILIALNETLKEKWRIRLSMIAPPVIISERIAVAKLDNDTVVALDLNNGQMLWKWNRCDYTEFYVENCGKSKPSDDTPFSYLYYSNGKVIFNLYNEPNSIVALDASSGAMLWYFDDRKIPHELKANYGSGLYPFVVLVSGVENESVTVVHSATQAHLKLALNGKGEVLWHKCLDDGGVYRASEGKLFVWPNYFSECVPEDKRKPGIYALDLLTGRELWIYETTSGPQSFAVANGKVFFAERYRNPAGNLVWRIVALNAENGAKIWERDMPSEVTGVYYANEELLIYYFFAGKLSALSSETGKPLEVGDNPGFEKTIGIWDGKLYVFEKERIRLFVGG
ncbi:MAG: PQQ-binding-like beta-propeller repeat protein [Archaeoglobaceae archaeon]